MHEVLTDYLRTSTIQTQGRSRHCCFVERLSRIFARMRKHVALVTPQNWLFLGRYETLRERLLTRFTGRVLAFLGTRAFETIRRRSCQCRPVCLG